MKVGDKVIVSGKLNRQVCYKRSTRRKVWKRIEFVNTSGIDAIFLGYRTVSDGSSYWESECGYIYEPESHKKVALVMRLDGRTNPFYATLNDVKSH